MRAIRNICLLAALLMSYTAISPIATAGYSVAVLIPTVTGTAIKNATIKGSKALIHVAKDGSVKVMDDVSDDLLKAFLRDNEQAFTKETYDALQTKTGKELREGMEAALKSDEVVMVIIRSIDGYIPTSGTKLVGRQDKTVTILGRWAEDMEQIKVYMTDIDFNVGTSLGKVPSNNGGFNFLNVPPELEKAAGEKFFELYNIPWLDAAISRGDDIVLATKPISKMDYIDDTGRLLGNYAEELRYLTTIENFKPANLTIAEWDIIKTWFPK